MNYFLAVNDRQLGTFWILLIITVPVAIFDKFFRPYCMTVIERMCNKDES